MKEIQVSNDIIPVGQFKAGLAKYLNEIQSNGNSLIITQNGRPAGVLISPQAFDDMRHTRLFLESVSRGISDSEKGDILTTTQLRSELQKSNAKKNEIV